VSLYGFEDAFWNGVAAGDRLGVSQRGAIAIGKCSHPRRVSQGGQFLASHAIGSAQGRVQLDSKTAPDERRHLHVHQIDQSGGEQRARFEPFPHAAKRAKDRWPARQD
jgi:hypothetical protein